MAKESPKEKESYMALTRSMLKGMGLTDEQIGAIIDAHTETVDGLKADRDKYKTEAEEAGKKLKDFESAEDWQDKYTKEHEAYENYKKDIAEKEKLSGLKAAYRKLLLSQNVGENHIDSILRVTDFSKMKIGEDGKLEDEAKLIESIKADWSGFIATTQTKGATVSTPPANNPSGTGKTKEEILAIKDTAERQKEILANHEMFGI